jgi:hypothetical protein
MITRAASELLWKSQGVDLSELSTKYSRDFAVFR